MVDNTNKRIKKRDEVACITAELLHVTPDYVRKVFNHEREDEQVVLIAMDYIEGRNKLIEHIKTLIPLDYKPNKRKKTTLKDLRDRQQNMF